MQRHSVASTSKGNIQQENEDLKQKIRTLEQKNKLLHNGSLSTMQAAWEKERQLWHSDSVRLHSAHRIIEQRLSIALDESSLLILDEKESTRLAKLSAVHKDIDSVSLNILNDELQFKLADLEEELQNLRSQYQNDIQTLKLQVTQTSTKLTNKNQALGKYHQEHEEVHDELLRLREDHAKLQSAYDLDQKKIQRLQLEYDGEVAEKNDVARERDELKRSIAELKRQMGKWKGLERQGDDRADDLHKQLMQAQVEKTEAENRVKKMEESLKKRQEMLVEARNRVLEWEKYAKEEKAAADEEYNQLQEQLDQLVQQHLKKIKKLETKLETRDDESQSSKHESNKAKGKKRAPEQESDAEPTSQDRARGKRKTKQDGEPEKKRGQPSTSQQPAAPPASKSKGKQKATTDETKAEPPIVQASDTESSPKAGARKKRKINLHNQKATQPPQFMFATLGGDTNKGFNIPTDLSPVKNAASKAPQTNSNLGSYARTQGQWTLKR